MFIKLTAFEIENAWINIDKIEVIFTENGVTKLAFNGNGTVSVSESPEEIIGMIGEMMRWN